MALGLGGILWLGACGASAQDGLSLQIQPSEAATPRAAIPGALDLTLRWPPARGASSMTLVAGRPLLGPPARANSLNTATSEPDARSPGDLMFVGVEFQGGARLRIRKWGDGLKLSYRNSF